MALTFARICAACGMNVGAIFHSSTGCGSGSKKKSSKFHEIPFHHTLEGYLSRIHGTRAAGRGRTAPLFQAIKNRTEARSETPRNGEQLQRTNAWQMAPPRDCFWSVASTIGTGEAATGGTKSGEQRVTGAATLRVRRASRQS